jgi:hypothetical protein
MGSTTKLVLVLSAIVSSGAAQQLIGTSSVLSTLDNDLAGQAEAFQESASTTGTLTTMNVYLDSSNAAKSVYVGIYSNSSGHPKTLLGSGVITAPVAGRWNTITITPSVPVIAGTSYHVALLGTGGQIQYRDTGGGKHSETSQQATLTSLPSTWTSGQGWPSAPLSAYGSGTTGGGGVSISISPTSIAVDEGGQQQLTATVSGTTNGGVNWSVLNGTGSVSQSGLFTAPNRQESDTVQAQSQADTTKKANGSVTVPAVGISISPVSAAVQPGGTQQFTATVTGTTNTGSQWSEIGNGSVNQNGLYTAPNTNETDTVTAKAAASSAASKSATATVSPQSQSACGASLNWTSSVCQQVNGQLKPQWTVISRHGEYGQNETESNVPWAIAAGSSQLQITASAVADATGDFNVDGTIRTTSGSWPYTTGDVQMNTFNFTYGTTIVNGAMPSSSTHLWPAFWLLGANCQNSNKFSGDTGFGGCPNIGQAGYREIDTTECYVSGGWCQFHIANPSFGIGGGCDVSYAVDTNVHTFMTVWSSSSVKQYMDGNLVASCNQVMPDPMFLILQIQTGGISGTPNNSVLPASLLVNYVKVCKTTDGSCTSVPSTDPSVIFYDDFGAN